MADNHKEAESDEASASSLRAALLTWSDAARAVIATGLAVAALSVRRGVIRETYGAWRLMTR